MRQSLKTATCLILLLFGPTSYVTAQSTVGATTQTLRTYSLPDSLDGNTAKAVVETLLSGRTGVKLTLDHSTRQFFALGSQADHQTIVDAIDILRNPINVNSIDNLPNAASPNSVGQVLRAYEVEQSHNGIVKSIVEMILLDRDDARLTVDPKAGSLIVLASASAQNEIAKSLQEFFRQSVGVDHNANIEKDSVFTIHSFRNALILLNSKTGETWMLREDDASDVPTWHRLDGRDR